MGDDLNVIYPDNFGVHHYYYCLFTTDALIESKPALIERFLRATFKGWRRAVDNPDEAGALVTHYAPDADVSNTIKLLKSGRPLVTSGGDPIGWMRPEVWREMVAALGRLNIPENPVRADDLYTVSFLNRIYEGFEPPPRTMQPTPLVLQLGWYFTSDFAGFYVADDRGYYADENLQLRFLAGGPDIDPVDSVMNGNAQFGTAKADSLIVARFEGKSVRAIAVIQRRSPLVFMTLKNSGITRPEQFAGKTIFVSRGSRPALLAATRKVGLRPGQFKMVGEHSHETDYTEFFNGEIDVWVGFLFDEAVEIEAAGYELNFIHPENYGVHNYATTIFATDRFIAENPDVVTRFLRATLQRGWKFALQNPEAAGGLTAQYDASIDKDHESAYLTALLPLINTGEDHVGWMKPEIWAEMTDNLGRLKLLANPVDPAEVYTLRFLEEIYRVGE
jgi:NitT/TauT family transport system substrate-binding protein